MFSQECYGKSIISPDIKNLNEEQVVNQIKSIFIYKDKINDIVFSELIKEIMIREDSNTIFIKVLKFFWTLESKNFDSYIYIFINSLANFNVAASYSILDSLKEILNEVTLVQECVLSSIPVLVENIRRNDSLFTGYIDVTKINERPENIIPLVKVLREMNTLTGSEKNLLIKNLLEMITTIDLEFCPGLVNEILHLCGKNNFQFCVGAVVNFFNQRTISCSQLSQSNINVDSRRLISIQTSVLHHYYEIAKNNNEFVKEILKLCKNNNALYSISGFMCIILLNLAGLEFIKAQILDMMTSCITSCYKDTKLFIESAFIRESVFENFDMDSLLMNSIKYCCISEREHISKSLLELGFLLIKSGLPRSKITSLKSGTSNKKGGDILISEMCNNDINMNTAQRVGQAGIQMVIQLFKRLPRLRQLIIDNIQNFILKESHKVSVFVYLELFADLISLMPTVIFDFIDEATTGQPIFELLCHFREDVAVALVNAMLPLIRYSSTIRNNLISIIMNNILSGRSQSRLICVESALTLLKYLRITVEQFGTENVASSNSYLTQCSQFACTQIAADSKPLPVDNFNNDEICSQILQIINESSLQYPDTKSLIYKGLLQVIEKNYYFAGRVVMFLLEKLQSVVTNISDSNNISDNNPFVFSKILSDTNVLENLPLLVSCLAESVRQCRKNMPENDLLSAAVEENACISQAVSKAEKTLDQLSLYLSRHDILKICQLSNEISASNHQMFVEQFIDFYEVLLVHFMCSNNQENNEKIEKLFQHKELALKSLKTDRKPKKSNTGSVISLTSLIAAIRYLFDSLLNEAKTTDSNRVPNLSQRRFRTTQAIATEISIENNNSNSIHRNIVENVDSTSMAGLLNEKVSIYLLNKAINTVKTIGSPEYRISYRNRKDICILLRDFVSICLDYYVNCLRRENIDTIPAYQRQIMHHSITLYCLSINKAILFCSKSLDIFLDNLFEVADHIKSLQASIGLISSDEEFSSTAEKNQVSMSSFVRLHKYMVSMILIGGVRKLYGDIDSILNATLNIAIFCGIEDARKSGGSDFAYGTNHLNVLLLTNLNAWSYNILKSSKLHFKTKTGEIVKNIELSDTHVCRCLFYICMVTSRAAIPDSVNTLEKFVIDMSVKIGSYSGVAQETPKLTFEFIVHPTDLLVDLINALTLALDDVDCLLFKWKCSWQGFKQRKAINNSQLSNINSTPSDFVEESLSVITDQERLLFEQLFPLCTMLNKLIGCAVTNIPRLQSLIKLCTRIFDQLTTLVKQYISLIKSKMGCFASNFEKLVRISGGTLSFQASQFIVYNQKIESISRVNSKENKKNNDENENNDLESQNPDQSKIKAKKSRNTLDSQIGRTTKEIRLMPNLVFAIEQYQRYLIELQKVSKIDFMCHVKTLNSRDFRIDLTKLQQSLDENKTLDLSDDETVIGSDPGEGDEEMIINENAVDLPPKKKQRICNTDQ